MSASGAPETTDVANIAAKQVLRSSALRVVHPLRSQFTAAHRSLPLGTKVKVTNLRTGRDVVVKINDRGPYRRDKHRIIDLSEAAAARIGIIPRGVERVRVVAGASQATRPKSRS